MILKPVKQVTMKKAMKKITISCQPTPTVTFSIQVTFLRSCDIDGVLPFIGGRKIH